VRTWFERLLPKVGVGLNIISSLGSGVVDLLAMRIVSKSTGVSIFTGIIGTVCTTTLNWLVFLFSNARQDYAEVGKSLDQRFFSTDVQAESLRHKISTSSNKVIAARLALTGAVTITTILDAISQFQQIETMSEKARAEGMAFTESASLLLAISVVCTNAITEFWTYNSFANIAVAKISEIDSNQSSANASLPPSSADSLPASPNESGLIIDEGKENILADSGERSWLIKNNF